MRSRIVIVGGLLVASALVSAVGCGDDDVAPPADPSADAAPPPAPMEAGVDAAAPIDGVLLTYGECASLTPCDGDLEGAREIVGGCFSDRAFDGVKSGACSGVKETDVQIVAKGTVSAFDGGMTTDLRVTLTGNVFFPRECMESQNLGDNCDLLRIFMTNAGTPPIFNDAGCVAADDGACLCNALREERRQAVETYTLDGGIISAERVSPPPESRTYGYCTVGDKLFMQDITGGVPYVLELAKK